jgi:hypothetical protein
MKAESKLEVLWFYALEPRCPLPVAKTRSISKLAIKGLTVQPNKFLQLPFFVSQLWGYCENKNDELSVIDIQTYIAWKIWQYKLEDIDGRILNHYCRAKGHLIAKNVLAEFHKSASRIKKYQKALERNTENISQGEELLSAVKELKNEILKESNKALAIYEEILALHYKSVKGISELIKSEIKQLKGVMKDA